MTLDLDQIKEAVASANPAELRRWVEALRHLCIPCKWSPPRHCGRCPCCRPTEPRYRFYRLIRGQKIYFFSRLADTFNPANAAPYTEADWLEWGEAEGLQREEVDAK